MDFREDRIGSALAGTNPTVLARMSAWFAVIGDGQHLPGYCVLLTDDPNANSLFDLTRDKQHAFLNDMARLGQRNRPTFSGGQPHCTTGQGASRTKRRHSVRSTMR